ncbi:MAG: ATP-binding protein [Micropepsaceae bacterium]
MSWLSPRTVRGGFVLIVLSALLLSQVVSLALLASQQTFLTSALHEAEALRRAAGIVSLAKDADDATRSTIQLTSSSPSFLVSFDRDPGVEQKQRNAALSAKMARRVDMEPDQVRVAWNASANFSMTTVVRRGQEHRTVIITRDGQHMTTIPLPPGFSDTQPTLPAVPPVPPIPPEPPEPPVFNWSISPDNAETEISTGIPSRLDISIALRPDLWLNVTATPPVAPSMMWPLILAGLLAAVLVAIAAIWAAGRIARPIAGLTKAAERLGRGDALVLAPEEGPQDVRKAASAFNAMATRLRRMIEDQRALLSAVGHDLRTPIASLRIRTELIKDPELQGRMLNSLDEMERLTEAALAAARGGESGEPLRPVDLPSLIEAVCDDLADTGSPVSFAALPSARVEGRASELRRALRNLIENAVRYGHRAKVSLLIVEKFADINVDDDGPGIPEDSLVHVMKPFVRLEESRSVETGGHGLGLTIARAIAERHDGELKLQNRAEGGLRATLRLPLIKI